MQKIIGAKKLGENSLDFFACEIDVKTGDKVVVQFDEFQTIAVVKEENAKISKSSEEFGKVLRIATDSDLAKFESLKQKAKKEIPTFKKKSLELGLMMKFVTAEYSLDGSKILIVFSSEERVDFRQLLKELASILKTRIELKQIGQRDEVKVLGGVGPCGEPCCCARFLKEFEHVTVKMAKIQSLSLSPTKINGICGRLMCCLGYESKMYEEILAKMPKVNSEVETPKGKGTVVYNDILRERVSVKRMADGDTIVVEEFELYDIKGFGKRPEIKEEEKEQEERNLQKNEDKAEKKDKLKKDKKKFDKTTHQNKTKEQSNQPEEMILGGEDKISKKTDSESGDRKKFKRKPHGKFFNKNNKK